MGRQCGDVHGIDLSLGNNTAAAVLLLAIDEHVYALCYGMGFHLLNYEYVEPGFGLRYLARVADGGSLRSVTRHTIDRTATIDRRSIPSGGDARAFGLADLGVVVSKVVGRSKTPEGKAVTIRGADALSMPLHRDPTTLVGELRDIAAAVEGPVAHPDLEFLTRLTPLQAHHSQRKTLDERLEAALRGQDGVRLGTGWPWDRSDEFGAVDFVRLIGVPGSGDVDVEWLSIDDLKQIVDERSPRSAIDLLRKIKVMLMSDEESPESPQIPAIKWVAYETRVDDRLYVFHDGRWFAVAQDYERYVRAEAARVLSSVSRLTLPPWPGGVSERDYNESVAGHDPAYLALDRRLIRTQVHPRGVEHCDLLGPNGELIHVKRLRASEEASHLFSQALVAVEQLLHDPMGRAEFARIVAEQSRGARKAPEPVTKVVLAIAGRGKLDVDDLFTFSQVTLVRLNQYLKSWGVDLEVVAIPPS